MLAACCSSSLELDHSISISLHLDNSRAMPNLPSNNRMIVRRLLGQSQFRAVILHKASFLFLMLLLLFSLAGWGEAYTLLPLPASSKAAARSWGKLRTRLLGSGSKPGSTVLRRDAGGPNTPVKERMILRSASAPSPPTAQVVPPEAEEGGVEMFMDEIGKIDGAMMVCSGMAGGGRGQGREAILMLGCSDCMKSFGCISLSLRKVAGLQSSTQTIKWT